MNRILKEVLEQAESWPLEDQRELAEYAREIEARRTGIYTIQVVKSDGTIVTLPGVAVTSGDSKVTVNVSLTPPAPHPPSGPRRGPPAASSACRATRAAPSTAGRTWRSAA